MTRFCWCWDGCVWVKDLKLSCGRRHTAERHSGVAEIRCCVTRQTSADDRTASFRNFGSRVARLCSAQAQDRPRGEDSSLKLLKNYGSYIEIIGLFG